MAYCPLDGQPCIDDLCYGSGCLRMNGEPMVTPCFGCKQLVPVDGSDDYGACECEPTDCPVDWEPDEEGRE